MDEGPVARIENLTIRYGAKVAADSISITVPRGSVYALLGRNGAGKSSILRCLLGQLRPQAGSARLFGEDSWHHRAQLMKRVGVVPDKIDNPRKITTSDWFRRQFPKRNNMSAMLTATLSRRPELLVLYNPTRGADDTASREFLDNLKHELAGRAVTTLIASDDPCSAEGIADRIGILRKGRLILDEEMESVQARFRRIRYSIDRNAENSAPGTELDPFFALEVRVRGWGVEAVVSDYSDEAFEKFRGTPGVDDATAEPLTLEELYRAVA